jgi:hypothetical protein
LHPGHGTTYSVALMKRVDRGSNSGEKYTPIVIFGVNREGIESGFFRAIIRERKRRWGEFSACATSHELTV